MGCTRASGPKRRALIWNTNPRIMLAMPASQTGRRASPEDEPDIKACRLIAPGAEALAHRGRGRAETCGKGQQDRLLHQPAPSATVIKVTSPVVRCRRAPAGGGRQPGARHPRVVPAG